MFAVENDCDNNKKFNENKIESGANNQSAVLTVPSPMFCTLHGIWTLEPTWAIMVVRFSVLKMVLLTVSLSDSSLALVLLSLSTFLKSFNTLLLSLMLFLLINSTALGLTASLSRSKIFVWFCSVFLGIIRKPAEDKTLLVNG